MVKTSSPIIKYTVTIKGMVPNRGRLCGHIVVEEPRTMTHTRNTVCACVWRRGGVALVVVVFKGWREATVKAAAWPT